MRKRTRRKRLTKIKILANDYKILVDPGASEDGHYGTIRYGRKEIVLNADAKAWQQASSIIHEIIHALEDALKLDLSESQVKSLGTGLVTVFRDNPELARRICMGERIVESPK